MPRVSVIIPTYNCAQFIGRAIHSVFAQTYVDYEVIVVDDGSTDETKEVIAQWDRKITYLSQSNRGVSAARNYAISRATGEFLAYLDADDKWYPRKLELCVDHLDFHLQCGFVHSEITVVDENDLVIFERFNLETERPAPYGACIIDLLKNSHIETSSVVERRRCFEETGGFNESLRSIEDYLHWIEIAANNQAIGYIDEPLAYYRRRKGSLSTQRANMAESMLQMLHLLLNERRLLEKCGSQAEAIVRDRLNAIGRTLPYLYRKNGQSNLARQWALALIRKSPGELILYWELLKSLAASSLLGRVKRFCQDVSFDKSRP